MGINQSCTNNTPIFVQLRKIFLYYVAMEEITHFAPALRSTSDQIKKENEFVASLKLFSEILGSMSGNDI